MLVKLQRPCNGTAFFAAAFRAEQDGLLAVPPLGVSPQTGQPCLSTRSFDVVDQDPSDNVTTTYLLTRSGQTAQFSAANQASLPDATRINNGSDNELLDAFLDPALGCTPFEAPDQSQGDRPGTSQALDELSAAAGQQPPFALVPENDEMVLVNGGFSAAKTDLYRSSIGEPAVSPATDATSNPVNFCRNMTSIQPAFLSAHQGLLAAGPTPVPAVGDNLLTFMANRLSMSFANLHCADYGLTDPVSVTLGPGGAAVAARFSLGTQPPARCHPSQGGYQSPAARHDGTHPAGWERQPATGR